jgi:hypothetical protein
MFDHKSSAILGHPVKSRVMTAWRLCVRYAPILPHGAAPLEAVIPAYAGIQYCRVLMFNRESSAILGHPVKSRVMTVFVVVGGAAHKINSAIYGIFGFAVHPACRFAHAGYMFLLHRRPSLSGQAGR